MKRNILALGAAVIGISLFSAAPALADWHGDGGDGGGWHHDGGDGGDGGGWRGDGGGGYYTPPPVYYPPPPPVYYAPPPPVYYAPPPVYYPSPPDDDDGD